MPDTTSQTLHAQPLCDRTLENQFSGSERIGGGGGFVEMAAWEESAEWPDSLHPEGLGNNRWLFSVLESLCFY